MEMILDNPSSINSAFDIFSEALRKNAGDLLPHAVCNSDRERAHHPDFLEVDTEVGVEGDLEMIPMAVLADEMATDLFLVEVLVGEEAEEETLEMEMILILEDLNVFGVDMCKSFDSIETD
eukprot:3158007-Amphidinium_carterae.1